MTTLAQMKAEIAADLGRSDLTTYIASAISDAIEEHQSMRFWFNESRNMVLETTSGTARYSSLTSGPVSSLDDVVQIDSIWSEDGQNRYRLSERPYEELELMDGATTTSRPWEWTRYGSELWLYPTPDDTYTIRIFGHYKVAKPASDSETGNVWMTTAYRMILAYAKSRIYQRRIRNPEFAQADWLDYQAQLHRLIAEGGKKLGSGFIEATRF